MADSGLGVREETVRANSPASINSLQIALFSLKDRCTKQQKRIDDLEGENIVLNNSRAEIYAEMKKLHEANVKLREKNLSLSHELHMRSKENCEMKVQWDTDRSRNLSNVRQLERLQKDVIQRSARTISMEENDSEDDTIASMKYEVAKDASETDIVEDEEMRTLVDTGADTMSQIKQNLQSQQVQILGALKTLQQKKTLADQRAESLISASLAVAVLQADTKDSTTPAGRCCPMCEAVFPTEISHEEFESHVVEHFSYEESDTLRNFDTVPDAFWPGIEHDPETMGGM
eukprot:GFUD01032890.1.p1 GENE.GFUD01032890.1~~GFUD01032890.1.p1  ORF type:complete len:289 (+),score=90.20 GFUD01032890.1:51-917(+)